MGTGAAGWIDSRWKGGFPVLSGEQGQSEEKNAMTVRGRLELNLFLLGLLLVMLHSPARAIERGYPAYANGAQTFLAGYLPSPPAGLYLSYSSLNYQANKFQGLPGKCQVSPVKLSLCIIGEES
jgi:hypothetical protein